jgi:hypothetical protein
VGVYVDDDGMRHGFVLERGRFTSIDVPGAVDTDAFGVNDRGQIVGAFRKAASPPTPSAERAGPRTMLPQAVPTSVRP